MGKCHLEMKMPESHRVILLLLVLGGLQLHSSSKVSFGKSWNKQKAMDCLSKEDLHLAASYCQNTVLQYACYFTTRKVSTFQCDGKYPGFFFCLVCFVFKQALLMTLLWQDISSVLFSSPHI